MAGSHVDELLVETIDNLLADHCTPEQVGAAEGGLDPKLWDALADSGLLTVGVAESAGGSGGSLHDAAAIAKAAGRYAAPVPLTETSIIGGWVCEQAGLPLPDGPLAVVIATGPCRLAPGARPGAVGQRRRPPVLVTEGGVAIIDPATLLPGTTTPVSPGPTSP